MSARKSRRLLRLFIFGCSLIILWPSSLPPTHPPQPAPASLSTTIPDHELMKYLSAAEGEYGCAHMLEPVESALTVDQYRQILGCHELFLITSAFAKEFQLGQVATLRREHRIMYNVDKGYAEAESRVAATFSGLIPDLARDRLSLSQADLVRLKFYNRTEPMKLEFFGANMGGAGFYRVNLTGANFYSCFCSGTAFWNSNLNDSDFSHAVLLESEFVHTKLSGAHFDNAIVNGMRFNPQLDFLPAGSTFVTAKGLSEITYFNNTANFESDAALLHLRDDIKKVGNREAFREINYAVRSDKRHYDTAVEYWFNHIFFGLTVGYGLYVARPLIILALLVLIFAVVYLLTMTTKSRSSGVLVVLDPERIKEATLERNNAQITLAQPYPDKLAHFEGWQPEKRRPMLLEEELPFFSGICVRIRVLHAWIVWREPEESSRGFLHYSIARKMFVGTIVAMIGLHFVPDASTTLRDPGKLTINYLSFQYLTTIVDIHVNEIVQTGASHADFVALSDVLTVPLLFISLFVFPNKETRQAWRIAVWFSLLSAFKFGWRDLSVGNWLAMLQPKGYSFRPIGIPKAIAGLESLLGLVMVGLWAFCYFVGPLE